MRAAIAAVLAGGRGRRLGTPKAAAELGGRPLVSHPIAAARAAGLTVAVVAKPDTTLPALDGVELWLEPAQPTHPLLGVVTALERAGGQPVVALGCDLPFVSPELLAWLAAAGDAPATVPVAGGRLQPLLACYRPEALLPLRKALGRREALTAAVAALPARLVSEAQLRRFGDPERLTFNVNTAEDLAWAAARLTPRLRSSSGAAGGSRVRPRGA